MGEGSVGGVRGQNPHQGDHTNHTAVQVGHEWHPQDKDGEREEGGEHQHQDSKRG